MLAVDHVIVVVEDLETAARRYDDEHGLASVPGGRHVGHGTGNRIVPLGSSYIELMAVVDRDEAATSPVGSWVGRRLAEVGEGPGALCLRTDDIEAAARRTGHQPLAMGRTRPDGVATRLASRRLTTRPLATVCRSSSSGTSTTTTTLARAGVEHRVAAVGIEWVEIGGDPELLASWLGPHDLPLRVVAGAPGPRRVAVAIAGGAPLLIG